VGAIPETVVATAVYNPHIIYPHFTPDILPRFSRHIRTFATFAASFPRYFRYFTYALSHIRIAFLRICTCFAYFSRALLRVTCYIFYR